MQARLSVNDGALGNANHGDQFNSDSIQSKSVDVRVGLSKLNMSITEVDHKIHELMGQHSKAFVQRLGQIKQVRDTMASLNTEMQQIEETGTNAKKSKSVRLNDAGNLVARTRNILSVYATLVDTMDQISSVNMMMALKDAPSLHQHAERVLSASLLMEELQNESPRARQLIDDSLRIDIVAHCVAEIPHMQDALLEQVENVLMCGLRSLSPPLLGTALQSALHLKFLGPVVQNFSEDLNDVLLERMRTVLDLLALGKELGETQPPILPSHLKTHPTEQNTFPSSLPRWTNAIWERLKTFMVDELGSIMIKVKMLERILQDNWTIRQPG
ncbi:hypothetical protein MNAN1_001150 [Malassezia nana]|uniref:Conserved oligomeric Golgi complex subunit 5 helical domain-containing protein n=1 Tax=Malassezia nana TaxID=180528 RepID=A0AAF0EK71_9BASI|nr:hypothetical protein MNAN1_001150 [Malassezia nana]